MIKRHKKKNQRWKNCYKLSINDMIGLNNDIMMLNRFLVDSVGQCYLKDKCCIAVVPSSIPISMGREQTSKISSSSV